MHVLRSLRRRRGKNTFDLNIRIYSYVQRGNNIVPRILLVDLSLWHVLNVVKIERYTRSNDKG